MRITIFFGGTNKERLVSVASAQALHSALPDADLWFWDVDDTVHEASSQGCSRMRGRSRIHSSRMAEPWRPRARARPSAGRAAGAGAWPARRPGGEWRTAGDVRDARRCLHRLRLGLVASCFRQGGRQALCHDRRRQGAGRGGAGDIEAGTRRTWQADRQAGPRDGSSYGLIFVNAKQDLVAVRNAARTEEYVIEPFVAGTRRPAACWSSRTDRCCAAADRDRPGGRRLSTTRQISRQTTQEICPGRFSPEISAR